MINRALTQLDFGILCSLHFHLQFVLHQGMAEVERSTVNLAKVINVDIWDLLANCSTSLKCHVTLYIETEAAVKTFQNNKSSDIKFLYLNRIRILQLNWILILTRKKYFVQISCSAFAS